MEGNKRPESKRIYEKLGDMKTICFMVSMHDRLDELEVFIENVESLKRYYNIKVAAVSSDNATFERCIKAGFRTQFREHNKPLGAKRNQAVRLASTIDAQAYFNMAEDHIINKPYIDYCISAIQKGLEFVASLDGYFYDYKSTKCILWNGYEGDRAGEPNGTGKCFSKELLQRMNWKIVDDNVQGMGLCGSNWRKLQESDAFIHTFRLQQAPGAITCDLKNGSTLNPIELLEPNSYRALLGQMLYGFPDSVADKILEL